ncbi:MAG: hydroxyethylthiazole kinase [Myxococcales bacterium]|nr:hydroxyethylthiazole kinase [Myxococcales bacterium]
MSDFAKRCAERLALLRQKRPMIHHITNAVVQNFTANVTLCLGAAPVMAPARAEVEQMVSAAGALLLNIGTLDEEQVDSMICAGKRANALGIPVVLDPVGAGATKLRTDACRAILDAVRLSVLRGNAGEVLSLAGASGRVRGVDSLEAGGIDEDRVRAMARDFRLTVAVTGAVDVVSDGQRLFRVRNGHPLMARVTGTGCAATTAVAAFLAVDPMHPAEATACALAVFGLAGEIAAGRAAGPGTFVPHLLDALAGMDERALAAGLKVDPA